MRKTLTAAALTAATATGAMANGEKPDLVTILTTSEPQTQLMAMVLSMQSLQQGANVDILLCGPAGDLALKEAPEAATAPQKPKGMSPQGLMKMVMSKGGTVEVCAIYLPNKGVGSDALIEGITAAKPPMMAAKILAENARVMSF